MLLINITTVVLSVILAVRNYGKTSNNKSQNCLKKKRFSFGVSIRKVLFKHAQ